MPKVIPSDEAAKLLMDSGLLFEINRTVLHPLGLALSVEVTDLGDCAFHGIYDCTDEAEGVYFSPEDFREGMDKLQKYLTGRGGADSIAEARMGKLGYLVQKDP